LLAGVLPSGASVAGKQTQLRVLYHRTAGALLLLSRHGGGEEPKKVTLAATWLGYEERERRAQVPRMSPAKLGAGEERTSVSRVASLAAERYLY
jgi:hypothetical protein